RIRYGVDLPVLRVLIARWLFMAQMTSRYIGSGESQLQQDLDRIGRLVDGDAAGFVEVAERVLTTTLTDDFWMVSVPEKLVTSGPAMSPVYQCYLAALNTLDAEMFLLASPKVREWMDPTAPHVKGMEGHHLFPRRYLETALGITDLKRINQAANFAPTDWDTNIEISDREPAEYWPELVARRYGSEDAPERHRYWHALPEGWFRMDYDEFLDRRRKLMASVIKDGYEAISRAAPLPTTRPDEPADQTPDDIGLQSLAELGLLLPGDLLDPVDPTWTVDAVVSDDGNVVIDGIHVFDSLDTAAAHLGITNMDGLDFWALETPDGLVPLRDITRAGRA
ncbi:MAG: hypothetical protein LBU50_06720, partial [Cellulomonas sp.]|nr:hypothetical protein [Cellulomonas sp.]